MSLESNSNAPPQQLSTFIQRAVALTKRADLCREFDIFDSKEQKSGKIILDHKAGMVLVKFIGKDPTDWFVLRNNVKEAIYLSNKDALLQHR